MTRTAVALAVLLAPALAQAQPRPPAAAAPTVAAETQRAVEACLRGGRPDDPAFARGCLDRQRATLEPRLDRALAAVRGAQRPQRQEGFMAVQAAWAAYRDRSCEFTGSDPDAGAGAAADRAACLLEFTVSRIEELEDALRPPPAAGAAPRR